MFKRQYNLTGQHYGRLLVIGWIGKECWECRCDCGTTKLVSTTHLITGHTQSCGCLREETGRTPFKHGHSSHLKSISPTYRSWKNMLTRCFNPKREVFKYYGGRGITVDPSWLGPNGFTTFLKDMGERPASLTLDRFPDNNGNYGPSNCRWATRKEQSQNQRKRQNNNRNKRDE